MKYIKTYEAKNYQVLYHYMPLYNMIKVFEEYKKTGKIYLKTDIELNRTNGKPIVSLSRNASMNSVDLSLSKQVCRISLDGEKLATKFKMKPYADSTYTPGSDNEQEEMMFLNDEAERPRNYNSNNPSRYIGDITDSILRIDILTFVPEYRDEQSGYLAWSNAYDEYNARYINRNSKQEEMQEDHEIMVKTLYSTITDMDIPFDIKVVQKFVNYKYQDKYIDKWNRRSFIYNRKK